MMTHPHKFLLALAWLVCVPAVSRAQRETTGDASQVRSQISSLGESLRDAQQRPLHILYVHGIGATGPGDSQIFQRHLCALLKGCEIPKKVKVLVPVGRDYADGGIFDGAAQPPAFKYLGNPVWNTQDEWRASAPFVDHYVLQRSDGGPVVVDEINWWPLVFPLKCGRIMTGEVRLAGPNKKILELCSQTIKDISHPGRYEAYPWIDHDAATKLEANHAKGAFLNRGLKTSLMDWGFSDAVMAVGSMHDLFREGMRQLFVKSARFNADGSKTNDWEQQSRNPRRIDREFIVVSHSLGSYLVFSTLNLDQQDVTPLPAAIRVNSDEAAREDAAVDYILQRTSLVYFFANQIPLLELANVEGPVTGDVLARRIQRWRELRQEFGTASSGTPALPVKPPQLIAWSDPNDLLTWCIPEMKPLTIVNLYVRNTWWHWFIASPARAHDNYASNKSVLRTIMSLEPSAAKGEVCK